MFASSSVFGEIDIDIRETKKGSNLEGILKRTLKKSIKFHFHNKQIVHILKLGDAQI